jgi:hypothetical protein
MDLLTQSEVENVLLEQETMNAVAYSRKIEGVL